MPSAGPAGLPGRVRKRMETEDAVEATAAGHATDGTFWHRLAEDDRIVLERVSYPSSFWPYPPVDGRDDCGSLSADRQSVIPRHHAPLPLQRVDVARDRVALTTSADAGPRPLPTRTRGGVPMTRPCPRKSETAPRLGCSGSCCLATSLAHCSPPARMLPPGSRVTLSGLPAPHPRVCPPEDGLNGPSPCGSPHSRGRFLPDLQVASVTTLLPAPAAALLTSVFD